MGLIHIPCKIVEIFRYKLYESNAEQIQNYNY